MLFVIISFFEFVSFYFAKSSDVCATSRSPVLVAAVVSFFRCFFSMNLCYDIVGRISARKEMNLKLLALMVSGLYLTLVEFFRINEIYMGLLFKWMLLSRFHAVQQGFFIPFSISHTHTHNLHCPLTFPIELFIYNNLNIFVLKLFRPTDSSTSIKGSE